MTTPLCDIPEQIFLDDEFLYIVIDSQQQAMTIQTDAYNTVSMFVGSQADRCVITSDFARTFELLDAKRCQVNMLCVTQFLLSQTTHDRTFVESIRLLYDRKRFYWSPTREKQWLPPDASMKSLHHNRIGDARAFVQQLEHTLDRYWKRYVGTAIGGCELSCGLDSSVVAGHFADKGHRPVTASIIMPKAFGYSQRHKLQAFTERFAVESITTPAADSLDYPWVEVLQGHTSKPFYHRSAQPYWSSFDDLHAALAKKGITSFFSGVGGDELFEHVDHRHVMDNSSHGSQQFITSRLFSAVAAYASELSAKPGKELPIPLRSHSTVALSGAAGNGYIAHGLWHVSPLADPRLYAYMQTLPLHYFVDKLLLRIYANARRLPRSITLPDVNEDFRHAIVRDAQRLQEVMSHLLDNSILVKHQLFDRMSLKRLHQKFIAEPDNEDYTTALIFNRILFTELNLRSLGFTSL
jgi:hypothetical protein